MNKLLLLIAICFIALSAGAQNCGGLQPLDNTFSVVPFQGASQPYYRCDDGSSSAIQLPFTFCYYGASYSQVYINNN